MRELIGYDPTKYYKNMIFRGASLSRVVRSPKAIPKKTNIPLQRSHPNETMRTSENTAVEDIFTSRAEGENITF
jgi:hypothetical protein